MDTKACFEHPPISRRFIYVCITLRMKLHSFCVRLAAPAPAQNPEDFLTVVVISLVVLFRILKRGLVQNRLECGTTIKHVRRGRIVRGRVAELGSHPWAVMLGRSWSSCAGSLISSKLVLTAAHCVQ